ncbi:MAG: hypothetical protein Kow00121_57710 [Elainellaceae cyanobacterium]
MKLAPFVTAAIAATSLTFAAPPKAEATEFHTCYATSERLNFVYEDGQTGYYIYGDVFSCVISHDYSLRTIVNGYPVQFTYGSVTVDGYAFVVEHGQLYSWEGY